MDLIKDLGMEGKKHYAVFRCPVCRKDVKKVKKDGLIASTCSRKCGTGRRLYSHPEEYMNPYEMLCNAIILQAVDDWVEAKDKSKKNAEFYGSKVEILEKWFTSKDFGMLTTMDGYSFLEWLKRCYAEGTLIQQTKWKRGRS